MSPPLASIAAGVIDIDLLRHLAATNRKALERMIDISIDILDQVDPDPDLEPCGDDEPLVADGDAQDASWHEGASLVGYGMTNISREDDEAGCKPLWATKEGRDFVNARRANLGMQPIRRRR